MGLRIIFNIHMYNQDLALNNLQVLISHKTQPTMQLILELKTDS